MSPPARSAVALEEAIELTTQDGVRIFGTHYLPLIKGPFPRAVVFNAGAGIAARHYRHFARFLAAAGVPVLSYDYRGIGTSRPRSLRNFAATVEDWAEFDCRAAIDWMKQRHGSSTAFGIGHSIGALFFGGPANAQDLGGVIMISPHTGYYGDYRKEYRVPMALLWHGVMPALTVIFGYFPGRLLRLGDDLPKGVALEWAQRRRGITPSEPGDRLSDLVSRFSSLDLDAVMITITDDSFATEAAALRVQGMFAKLRFERWTVAPADIGLSRLGHFGFFRRGAAPLWKPIISHLTRDPSPAGARARTTT